LILSSIVTDRDKICKVNVREKADLVKNMESRYHNKNGARPTKLKE
jgi:hypothetical protein